MAHRGSVTGTTDAFGNTRRQIGRQVDVLNRLPYTIAAKHRFAGNRKPIYEIVESPPGNYIDNLAGRTVPSVRVTFPSGVVQVKEFKNYMDFMLWQARQARSVGYAN